MNPQPLRTKAAMKPLLITLAAVVVAAALLAYPSVATEEHSKPTTPLLSDARIKRGPPKPKETLPEGVSAAAPKSHRLRTPLPPYSSGPVPPTSSSESATPLKRIIPDGGSVSAAAPKSRRRPRKEKKQTANFFYPESLDVFILAGQSNMAGRAEPEGGNEYPPECQPDQRILRLNPNLKWEEAAEPLHAGIDLSGKPPKIGPGLPFAHRLLEIDLTCIGTIGLVPCAEGGTKIARWLPGGTLYNRILNRTNAAMERGGTVRALLWYQGESDTDNIEDAEAYKSRLTRLFEQLRIDLDSPDLPILHVALASGYVPEFMDIVREAQLGLDMANTRCVDAKGLGLQDSLHLNLIGQLQLGSMLGDAFLDTEWW